MYSLIVFESSSEHFASQTCLKRILNSGIEGRLLNLIQEYEEIHEASCLPLSLASDVMLSINLGL